jgi:hypothetical protein
MRKHKPNSGPDHDPGPELPALPSEAEAQEAMNELLRTWLYLPPAVQQAILGLLRLGRADRHGSKRPRRTKERTKDEQCRNQGTAQ